MTGDLTVSSAVTIRGGDGGDSGLNVGYGGEGGSGITSTANGSTLVNNGTIRGGNGGSSYRANAAGGIAIDLGSNFTINNTGTIQGGDSINSGTFGYNGQGAAAISGSDLTITNSGTIAGGMGSSRANAITFTGGTNTLTLEDGYQINGNVDATAGTSNTFQLSGASDSNFSVSAVGSQYRGFDTFEKIGASTWTLSGTGSQDWAIKQGSLKGGASSFQGDISLGNGTSLILDQAFDSNFTGSTSGSGQLIKSGTGTVNLARAVAHSGGTQIEAGRLVATTSTLPGNVAIGSGASFELAQSTDDTFAGLITGAGAFVKSGTGELTLGGANTYSGGTQIEAGRLVATTSTLPGNVAIGSGASLELDQVKDGTFAGDIMGAGSLIKSGASEITLSGANTYSGGTTINDGVLVVSDFSQLGTGDVDLNGGVFRTTGSSELSTGNLNLDGGEIDVSSNSLTITNAINGANPVTKTGSGVLAFNAAGNSIAGGITVRNGSLIVGSAASYKTASLASDILVETSGILGGHGTVTGNVTNNGRLEPGNSIGVTTINGDYTGSGTLEIEVDAITNQADQLVVTGDIDISNTRLDLVLTPTAESAWGSRTGPFIILDNQGGNAVTGTFASIDDNLLFLDDELTYNAGDGNDISLALVRNDLSMSLASGTFNQRQVGATIDGMDDANPVALAITTSTNTEAEANAAYDSLSGEINATTIGALLSDSRLVRDAMANRLYAAGYSSTRLDASGSTVWSQAYGNWREHDGDGNAADLDHDTRGVMVGADTLATDQVRIGVMASYSRTDLSADARNSSVTSDNYTLGTYIGTRMNNWALRGGVASTWHEMESDRSISVGNGAFRDEVHADQDARTLQAFGEVGYGLNVSGVALEPFANLAYVSVDSDEFTEKGSSAALSAEDQSEDMAFTTVGLRSSADFTLDDKLLTAHGSASWQHASNDTVAYSPSFVSGGGSFTVHGTPIDRDLGILEAGIDAHLNARTRVGMSYSGQFGQDTNSNGVSLNINMLF